MVGASGPPETSLRCPYHFHKVLAMGKKRKNKAACLFDVIGKHSHTQLSDNQFRSRSPGIQGSLATRPQMVETEVSI